MMPVLPILANLNLVASSTGTLFVMITMSVQLMNAFLLMVVLQHVLSVTITTNVLLTLVILKRDASIQLSIVMTMMLVPMILAALKLDANTLLALLMTMTYVLLMNARKMER
jgi:hypothetical protein